MSVERSPLVGVPGGSGDETYPAQPEHTPSRRKSQTRRPRRSTRWLWLSLTGLFLLIAFGIGGALFLLDRAYAGKIYPNVSIRGVAVGELTPDQAQRSLETKFAPFLAQPLTITYGDQSWTPTMAELGVRLEIAQAVEAAYAAGRGHNLFSNLSEVIAAWQDGLELPLRLTIDQAAMQQYLLARVPDVEQPAVDARIEIDGALTSVLPASSGQQVMVSDTLQEITAAIQGLAPQTVVLRTRELPPRVDDSAAQAAQAQISSLLAGPLQINIGGEQFEWSLEDLAHLIRIDRVANDTGDTLDVGVDGEQVRAKVAALAKATEIKGEYPRVDWNDGDLKIIKPGTIGKRIDEAHAVDLILATINNSTPQREITLPFVDVPSPVTAANLDQLGINELLSVGRSDFSGSAAYRITNIKAGMKLLHGVLLAPGEEFSFNHTVGRIDASNGFVEGYAIVQNRTQLDWGGGICQDSTTIFRAAFWAGLPITERWGHSFYISWYNKYAFASYGDGPGMDATIFTGGPDLKFLNDTGHWLLVQTFVDPKKTLAEVRIYGTSDGRTVSMVGQPEITDRIPAPTAPVYVADPKRPRGTIHQSDTARGGMTINFTRIVSRNGQEIERHEFQTKFRPWPNIFEVNPEDLGPDGKPLPTPQPTPEGNPIVDPNQQPQPGDGSQPAPQPAPGSEQPQPAPTADPATGSPPVTLPPAQTVPQPAQPPSDG